MKTKTTKQIATWYDLPGTNGNTKWVELKDVEKETKHLHGKIKQDIDKPCYHCETKPKYSEKYDSYYCPKCLYWLERICSIRECDYCKDRPKYPKNNQK